MCDQEASVRVVCAIEDTCFSSYLAFFFCCKLTWTVLYVVEITVEIPLKEPFQPQLDSFNDISIHYFSPLPTTSFELEKLYFNNLSIDYSNLFSFFFLF